MKQYKKRNTGGFSHHFLLPVIVVIAVAGIGGYVMLQSSSAATKTRTVKATTNGAGKTCKQRTYMMNAKSTCVSYAQEAMGIKADGIFGKNTRAALKSKTGSTVLNSASWTKLCSKIKSGKPALYGKAGCNGKSYTYTTGKKDTTTGMSQSECNRYKDKYFWNEKTNKCAKKEKQKVCLYSVKSYDPYVAKKAPSKPTCSDEMVLPSKVKAYNDSNKKIDKQYKADLKKWESYRKAQNDRNIPRAV